jgi:hypothetical protein
MTELVDHEACTGLLEGELRSTLLIQHTPLKIKSQRGERGEQLSVCSNLAGFATRNMTGFEQT